MQNAYAFKKAKILKAFKETPDIKTFLVPTGKTKITPGQFFMLGLIGVGESPVSVSAVFAGKVCFTIKRTGTVTEKLHSLSQADSLCLRGPFGHGFDLTSLKGRDILVIAGGLGLAPLRPLLSHILNQRKDFPGLDLLYGCRTPQEIVFKEDLKRWSRRKDMQVWLTVDTADAKWKKERGVVTGLLKKLKIRPENTTAIVCGPQIMMRYTLYGLLEMKVSPEEIILSLERHMKCGLGKCGHCYLGEKFVCIDGPVFRYSELLKLKPEIEL